ncbi:MAG: uracil phosphoribosyltransferase [Deltaproteobacteria bacterium]|nr:uracil phosphoribosyltransferase [Deltaproteobacteria bacterium]
MKYHLSEIEHRYGENYHILSDTFLLSLLAKLCSDNTTQPLINELVTTLYSSLLKIVVNCEFTTKWEKIKTRMHTYHEEGIFQGPVIDSEVPIVSVNLARAGTLPSHICYNALNYFMNPKIIRQDHISIGRTTDEQERVTGSKVSGHKIGGSTDNAIVLFPDPMGATGATIIEALDLYKSKGKASKHIALHCIITPEYIINVKKTHPDLIVYAIRLDRGLSPLEVLDSIPGTFLEKEKGLNHKHYIVPGGGGFGEVMNNAYV